MTRGLLAVLALALGLRLVGIDHSLPHRYVPDTHVIRGALGMAQEKSLAPPPRRYTSYPYLMPYVLLPEYAGLYAFGRVTGQYADAQDFAGQVIDDPTPLYRIARLVITLFGLVAVYLTYRIAARVTTRRTALIAAYLVATSFLMVHLGKSARPWVPLTAMVLLTTDRSMVYVRRPGLRRALVMGGAAGLAAACHQAGALAVLLPASALLARFREEPLPELYRSVGAAAGFVTTALLVGFPYLLLGKSAEVGVDSAAGEEAAVNVGGQSFAIDMFSLERLAETGRGLLGAEPALLALAAIGLLTAGWRGLKRPRLLPVLVLYPAAVLLLFLFYEGTHTRYLIPALPFLAIFGALGARRMMTSGIGRVVATMLLLFPLVQVVRLDYVMSQTDTRTAFLAEVVAHVPPDSVVAVEGYGPPLRFSERGMEILVGAGSWLSRAEQREAHGETPLEPGRPPYAVIPLERFYDFASVWPWQWSDKGSDPERPVEKPIEQFLDEVGASWLVRVDRTPGAEPNSALVEVLERRGERIAVLLPTAEGEAPPFEAFLPTDPGFALSGLWQVSRPGPALSLWRIRP